MVSAREDSEPTRATETGPGAAAGSVLYKQIAARGK